MTKWHADNRSDDTVTVSPLDQLRERQAADFNHQVAARTVGSGHVCQDYAKAFQSGPNVLVAIADGAGTSEAGAAAASSAMGTIQLAVDTHGRAWDPQRCCEVLRKIDQMLASRRNGGESTAVIAIVTSSGIAGASVGDSGAWLVTANGYEDLARMQIGKPLLGSGLAQPRPFRWSDNIGTLLVATDGLLKYGKPAGICEAARLANLEEAADRLIECVRLRSANLSDDVGLVLVRKRSDRGSPWQALASS